jgi:hypothetical protein
MSLSKHDDMVEKLSTDRANPTLGISVLPGRPGCAQELLDAHALDALVEGGAKDAISVAREKPGRRIVAERVSDSSDVFALPSPPRPAPENGARSREAA